MYKRLTNGTKERSDGKGDAWANAHRSALPRDVYMQDVDGLFGFLGFGMNTAERLFVEIEPDDFRQSRTVIRDFATLAFFDRKRTLETALHEQNRVSLAYYLALCRKLGMTQAFPPRFFFIIGEQAPPWNMYEINIATGHLLSDTPVLTVHQAEWSRIWHLLGLDTMRQHYRQWFKNPLPL